MILGYRQLRRPTIDLSRGTIEQACRRVVPATSLQQVHRGNAVHLQVELGVAHAVAVAYLAREMKNEILASDRFIEHMCIAKIGNNHFGLVADRRDILKASSELRNKRIDNGHMCATSHQLDGKVAAKKSQSAGDKNLAAGKLRAPRELCHFIIQHRGLLATAKTELPQGNRAPREMAQFSNSRIAKRDLFNQGLTPRRSD